MEVVTGAMGSLLPKLGELLMGEYKLQKGVKKDVESLEREMRSMNAALVKLAEVPWDQLDNQVVIWADELRELSYDMEDAVDNFLVCVEESESVGTADSHKLRWLVRKMANLFTKGKTRHQIANAIKDIKNRAKEVADRRDRYRVDDVVANAAGKHNVEPRVLALYKDQKELVGIEDARHELTKRLTDGDGDVPKQQQQQQHKMKIVSIVGPGGLGKTTLAKAVYDRLQTRFEYKAFIPVARNPEVKKVLKDILLEVDKNGSMGDVSTLDERQLIDKLRRLLENARYFIVIDDIWDLEAWNIIKCAFIDNNHGSRVITTTRILKIATNTGDIYKLKPLSQHLSAELFYARLFGGKDKCPFDQPIEVSEKFVKKCGGVPLAIITIASLLAGKPMDDWSKVFNSIGFRSGDNNADVENLRKILSFSYYDLPCHLRSCLLHLSMYPEDYLIMKDKLIWQWVAEGFVSEEPGLSLFETGERYFNELLNRSMIQPVESGKHTIYACRIHDMVLDMICLFSKQQKFGTILYSDEKHAPSQCNARRLAIQKRVVPLANMSMPKVRSCYATMCDPDAVPSLSNFQVLRVLAMEKCSFERDRPYHDEHLGRLLQLRYMSLESTHISKLPEEIGDLKFLQTLDLRDTHVQELPESIGLLRKLKCLRADVTGAGITVSNWIGNLTSLEELYLTTADESSILVKELSKLTELRVLFCNLTAEVDERWKKYFVESLSNLRKIQVLELLCYLLWPKFGYDYWKGYDPPRQLRDLVIEGGVKRLPAWINSSLLPNLSHLYIDVRVYDLREQDVVNLGSLPELTCLGKLCIPGGMEFPSGTFPKLRSCRMHAPFRFLQGSMQSLEFIFITVQVCVSTAFDFTGSLGNLPSLKRVRAHIHGGNVYACDIEKVTAAMRKAIDAHPNSPTLKLRTVGGYLLPPSSLHHTVGTSARVIDNNDEKEESDSKQTQQEVIDDDNEEDRVESYSEQTKQEVIDDDNEEDRVESYSEQTKQEVIDDDNEEDRVESYSEQTKQEVIDDDNEEDRVESYSEQTKQEVIDDDNEEDREESYSEQTKQEVIDDDNEEDREESYSEQTKQEVIDDDNEEDRVESYSEQTKQEVIDDDNEEDRVESYSEQTKQEVIDDDNEEDRVESYSEQTKQEVIDDDNEEDREESYSEQTKQEVIDDDNEEDREESYSEQTKQEVIDNDNEEDGEESYSEQTKQESYHDDDNRPTPHRTESRVDAAGRSRPVPATRQTWRQWACFACLNSGSSSPAIPTIAGSSNQCGTSGVRTGGGSAIQDDNEVAQP